MSNKIYGKLWTIALLFLLNEFFNFVEPLRFYVPVNDKRCLKEEIHKNVVLTGEYEISDAVGHTISVHVTFYPFPFNVCMFG